MPVPQMQYAPFVNPYAPSIGDEIARSGDAYARAAEIVGQANANATLAKTAAWSRAAENIGQLPVQVAATQNLNAERKLKEQELSLTVEQRNEAQRQRYVMTVGRIAGVSSSPAQFTKNVDDAIAGGMLPKDTGEHVKAQVAAAGDDPQAFRDVRQQYVTFADQYVAPMKLGKDETLIRPSVDPTAQPTVVARGAQEPIKGAPGDRFFQPPAAPGAPMTEIGSVPNRPVPVNGQLVQPDTGARVGEAVPKQETPSEVAERQARVDLIGKQIQEADQQLTGTKPLSPKDRAELEIQKAHLELSRTMEQIRLNHEDPNSPQNQEKLEQQYRQLAKVVMSSRSGALGVEDQKVGTAKHLMTMLNQAQNPDGTYDLARINRRELATGLARLISPTGQIAEGQVEELDQRTAKGGLADLVTYVTGNPKLVNATPQAIATLFRDSIMRQGKQAELNRDKELDFIRAARPVDLQPARAEGIERGLAGLNRMDDVLPGGRDMGPKDGQEGSVNGVAAVWKQNGPQGPGWYRK